MKTGQEHNNEQCTMNNVQWKKVKLGEVAKTFTGLTYSPNCIDKSGTLVLRSSNIKDGQLCFEDNVFVSMDIPERAIVQENDILICVRNGSRNLIGKSALITKDAVGMAFGAFMTVLRTNIIDPKLLLYIWQSNNIQRQVANNIGATINQITNADFNRFEISYPESLSAQRRIAAILASADKVIAATQKTIAKYKQIKQGMMEDLLKPKDGWKMVKLGEGIVKSICTGKLDANAMVEGGAYRFYTCAKDYTFIDNYAFDDEALLISGNGEYVGYVHYYKGKFNAYQRTYVLRGFSIDVNYLQCYLNMYLRDRIKKEMNAGSIPFIKMGTLTEMIICYPASLQEQKRMASILNGIDSKIEVEQRVLNKYIQVKKGLMEKLLND